jgi:23S rRNA pseudouridine2604 synthase
MELFGEKTLPLQIQQLDRKQVLMIMREGKNRQIRRMMRHLGLMVTRLKRVRFGDVNLDKLKPGEYRILS